MGIRFKLIINGLNPKFDGKIELTFCTLLGLLVKPGEVVVYFLLSVFGLVRFEWLWDCVNEANRDRSKNYGRNFIFEVIECRKIANSWRFTENRDNK